MWFCHYSILNKSIRETNARNTTYIAKLFAENHQPSLRWPKENNSPSSEEKQIITRHSPTTVLNGYDGEENSSSFGENSITKSSITSSSLATKEFKYQQDFKKPMSPLRRISSFLRSPFDSSSRKKSSRFQNEENKQQPPLKCFSYEEIASSTNYFHPGLCSSCVIYTMFFVLLGLKKKDIHKFTVYFYSHYTIYMLSYICYT